MYERCRSMDSGGVPDEAPALENPADGRPGELSPDLRRRAEAYRAEAARWEHIAQQVSLIPDREYLLSTACELRAKAAALEAAAAESLPRDPGSEADEALSGDGGVGRESR